VYRELVLGQRNVFLVIMDLEMVLKVLENL
jgi:hypothetical protein